MTNTVSVGMATFNSAKYVREQLESILTQTVLPDEIVICDDASTDNTVDILHSILDNVEGISIRIIENTHNLNYTKNFEKCFLACSCDIIVSCDADDIWFSEKIERIKQQFEDEKVVYVYHDAIIVDGDGKKIGDSLNATWDFLVEKEDCEQILLRDINRKGFPYGMTMAFRRSLLSRITPFLFAHDGWINMCAPLFGEIRCIAEPLTYYRRHGNNTSGKTSEGLLHKMKRMDANMWFAWPAAFVQSYAGYYEKYSDLLPPRVKRELETQIAYRRQLADIIENKSKLKIIIELLKIYKPTYIENRGNWKTFLIDCLFILQNKKGCYADK